MLLLPVVYPVIGEGGVLVITLTEQHIKVAVGALCVCVCERERQLTFCEVCEHREVGVVDSDRMVDFFFYLASWVSFVKGWTEELYGISAAMAVFMEMYLNATAARLCELH